MQEPEEEVNIINLPHLDPAVSSAAFAAPEATEAGASLAQEDFNNDEKSKGYKYYKDETTVTKESQTVRQATSLRASLQPGISVKCTIEEVLTALKASQNYAFPDACIA